jgi:putative ABC transport system permease protein
VLALSAVIAPLLLLFGLKFGYVQTLRDRLIRNPSNREIRPLASVERDRAWFLKMAARPDVAFMVPSIRAIAATVLISRTGESARDAVALLPSAMGDTLLIENHQPIPNGLEVVLTAMAAKVIKAHSGDKITLTALREDGDERASVEMKVIGVLGMEASGVKGVYAPLPLLESVEAYKDGRAAPELNWPGTKRTAAPVFDGAILILPNPLPEDKQDLLKLNTGFSTIKPINEVELAKLAGWSIAPGHVLYFLGTTLSPVHRDSLAVVRDQLRGLQAEVIPWVRPLPVTVSGDGLAASPLMLQGLSLVPEKAEALGISPIPPWGDDTAHADLEILLPPGSPEVANLQAAISPAADTTFLPLKVVGVSGSPGGPALVPTALAGVIRLGQLRKLTFDRSSGEMLLLPLGYAGFRMYARTIDDVEGLRNLLAEEGINVSTEAQEVAKVAELDRNLTRVFALISVTGIGGGVAALVASLYASVERKRRELGILRLIGLSRRSLMRFPLFQGLILVAAGFCCAALFFFATSQAIDGLFRAFRQKGESFCRLPMPYFLACFVGSLVLGLLAAFVAAYRVSRASAADALRDE